MAEVKSVVNRNFDRSGRYEGGLNSLVKSLKWAFGILLAIIIAMVVYFIACGGYFTVEPQQAVIVQRFGKTIHVFTTGGHWFLPYPINDFIRVQTNQQFLNVDFISKELDGDEPKESFDPGVDSYLLTGDANIIHTRWTVGYRVVDPEKYYCSLATPLRPVVNNRVMDDEVVYDINKFEGRRGPQVMLRSLFRQAVFSVTAKYKAGDVLTFAQREYSEAVKRCFDELVSEMNCGIAIESVVLDRLYPPAMTKDAFAEVTAAGTKQSTLRNQAEAYRVETMNDIQARSAEIIAAAETYRKQVVSSVRAESIYFKSISEQYKSNPHTVLMALYTQTLTEAMAKVSDERFVVGTNGKSRKIWLQLNAEPQHKLNEAAKKAQDAAEAKGGEGSSK